MRWSVSAIMTATVALLTLHKARVPVNEKNLYKTYKNKLTLRKLAEVNKQMTHLKYRLLHSAAHCLGEPWGELGQLCAKLCKSG